MELHHEKKEEEKLRDKQQIGDEQFRQWMN